MDGREGPCRYDDPDADQTDRDISSMSVRPRCPGWISCIDKRDDREQAAA